MRKLVCISALLALGACTPAVPRLTVEAAEDFCKKKIANRMITEVSLGVGVGTSGVKTNGGVSVGVDLDAFGDPEIAYAKCVKKYSGLEPVNSLSGAPIK